MWMCSMPPTMAAASLDRKGFHALYSVLVSPSCRHTVTDTSLCGCRYLKDLAKNIIRSSMLKTSFFWGVGNWGASTSMGIVLFFLWGVGGTNLLPWV